MKTLVAYYSRAGENYVCGQIKKLAVGNTEKIAEKLQQKPVENSLKLSRKRRIRRLITPVLPKRNRSNGRTRGRP